MLGKKREKKRKPEFDREKEARRQEISREGQFSVRQRPRVASETGPVVKFDACRHRITFKKLLCHFLMT